MGKGLGKRDKEIVKNYYKLRKTQEEIAEEFGISHQRVSAILRKPQAQAYASTLATDAREMCIMRAMLSADTALEKMLKLLDSKVPQYRYLAATDILNRAHIEADKVDRNIAVTIDTGGLIGDARQKDESDT